MCEKNGVRISNSDELLFRQVYPNWLEDNGQPSSQAFYPWRDVDDGCLSVDRATVTTANAAFLLFTTPKPDGFETASAGVWGLKVCELELLMSAWEDPIDATSDTPANPAHAIVEFGQLEKKQWKRLGRMLKGRALERGRIFPGPDLLLAAHS